LTSGFIDALGLGRQRRSAHDPGRVAVDLAVLLADGGEAIADLAVLRQQPRLFGPVASDATAWRVLNGIDEQALSRVRAARAAARELAWAQLAETRRSVPATVVLGRVLAGFVLDLDATIVLCHSEKESAAPTWKHWFGYHPLLCFLDGTGDALAGLLRPGNAGAPALLIVETSSRIAAGRRARCHSGSLVSSCVKGWRIATRAPLTEQVRERSCVSLGCPGRACGSVSVFRRRPSG